MAKRRPTASRPMQQPARPPAPAATEAIASLSEPTDNRAGGPTLPASAPAPQSGDTYRRTLLLGALLFLTVLGIYLPALRHDFITYDDNAYVTANPHVQAGLTRESVQWAWSSFEHSNWHPLTWMSHMLDCQLYGLAPWGHHLTNILLHACTALLLFVVLRRATGFLWRSLVVAALFGLHPLHVESVAWIAERKDVLSTVFWMLSLWAYVAYAQRRKAGRPHAWLLHALAFLALAVGLTAKPMLVTLPCVMLLLDLWPLGRWTGASAWQRLSLLMEKLPFFALSAVSCVLTYLAQSAGGAVKPVEYFAIPVRIANALVAYTQYLGKLFWPADLAVLYPNFGEMPATGRIVFALAVLAALSAATVLALRRGRAWAPVGWLWFLGTLVPVIGFVQVGGQTMADRYSYVPSIGVFILVVWAAAEATALLPRRNAILGTATAALLLACTVLTSLQLRLWRNSEPLFRHTIAVTEDNWMAHFNLFVFYSSTPATQSLAREEYERTVAIVDAFAERQNQRGLSLLRQGQCEEAIAYFRKSIRVKKDHTPAYNNLGRALLQLPGQLDEAVATFRTALQFDPDNGDAKLGLGRALAQSPGHGDEAIAELRIAVLLLPERADAHLSLATALARDPSRRNAAIGEYEETLRLDPASSEARAGLAALQPGAR
jgi:protein O-mannosyl-transferase